MTDTTFYSRQENLISVINIKKSRIKYFFRIRAIWLFFELFNYMMECRVKLCLARFGQTVHVRQACDELHHYHSIP